MTTSPSPRSAARAYKLRKLGTGKASGITLPVYIVEAARRAGIESFTVELTDDGILLRPGEPVAEPTPAWLAPKDGPA